MAAIPESHRDLLDGRFATLATIGADGRPQMSEVWFLADGDKIRISLNTSRQKSKNLFERPGCGVLLLDIANPFRYLEVRGDAEIEPDLDYAFADRVGAKYGADLRSNDGPGDTRVVVTIQPSRIRTWGG
jgi:PPOX class probable F420-dependent enzyme